MPTTSEIVDTTLIWLWQVWIHSGHLKIVKIQNVGSAKETEEKLSIPKVREIVLQEPERLLKSTSIEEEAFFRLRNYPQQIAENMHHALITLPRKIAFLLHQKPAYICPAIEAFYLRDPIALKPIQAKGKTTLVFSLEDLVNISTKFPRAGYAQLKSQDFPTPPAWNGKLPAKEKTKFYSQAEMGMKVTCGFEMLLTDPQNQDKPAVREMKMLLQDLDTGDEKLPTDHELGKWPRREDDENWLDISFEDLEGELAGKSTANGKKRGDFGDKAAQENLQRMVAQFEQFLNDDKAGPDGAGLFGEESDSTEDMDSDDEADSGGEDKEASFDEESFAKMMREMMGMPSDMAPSGSGSGLRGNAPKPGPSRVEELDSDDEEIEDMQSLMQQMEAELTESGALDLDPTPRKISVTKQAVKGKTSTRRKQVEDHVLSHDHEEDVNINLAKNLLESLGSQGGAPGPGGNLIGLMGLKMPRNEREEKR